MGIKSGLVPASDGNLWVRVNLATATDQTVFTGQGVLVAIHVNTVLSAHAVDIKDNATTMLTIPASRPAGSLTECYNMEVLTSLVVSRTNAAATGNITVIYRPYN